MWICFWSARAARAVAHSAVNVAFILSQKDLQYYDGVMETLAECSPSAKVFCLIHKMDLVPKSSRRQVYEDRARLLASRAFSLKPRCFQTSIWDETLYKAWSEIISSLVPTTPRLDQSLAVLAEAMGAQEIVLFEQATFLIIAQRRMDGHPDPHRFEKISNIIKQYKLACLTSSASFVGMTVRNAKFTAYIDEFTPSTYIMVVTTAGNSISLPALQVNVDLAKPHFSDLIARTGEESTAGATHLATAEEIHA